MPPFITFLSARSADLTVMIYRRMLSCIYLLSFMNLRKHFALPPEKTFLGASM